ncbi:MAG: preprotein translocase subunit SecE [Actinobacteria bacterium]|nr:preprotein translocase subunit SecE [Actinomycetota bacterium]
MAKRKVSRKYSKKGIIESQLAKERKLPAQKPREKFNFRTFIKKLPGKIGKFFRDVVHELKKVTWPSRKALFTYTVVVLVTIIIFGVLLGVYDYIFLFLVKLLARI